MTASSYFHRNVLLLTEVITTSDDFKIHFHEGMFDKPNTVGFIHVSQFLLTIYDANRFRKLIQWPIICKAAEVKYCKDVKDFLNVIANENPDVDFPPIVASSLACAHGRKFTVIMWKLSMVALRTYIKRNCNQNILYAPHLSSIDELIRTNLQKINKDTISSIISHRRNMEEIREKSTIIIAEEEKTLANIKRELFENKQSILHLSSTAPVHFSIKECLANVENTEIIQVWKQNITENIAYIKKKHIIFKNVETLSNKITNIIFSRISGTEILNTEQLREVNSSAILLLPSSTNVQYLLHHLYVNNKLMLFNFIQLFNLLLCQIYQCLRNNELKDLSECLLQIEASQEDMKSGIKSFQNLLTSIGSTSNNIKLNFYQKKMNRTYQENISPMKNVSLFSSPIIKINTNCCNEGNDLPKRLELTPVEGAHKYLFSRYKRQHGDNNISQLRTNMLVPRINFDDSISLNVSDKIAIPYKYKTNSLSTKHNGKYSRLFDLPKRKAIEKGNCSMLSIPQYISKANSTTITNTPGDLHNVSQFSLGNTRQSLFDLSKEITVPEKIDTLSNLKFDYQYKRDNQIQECSTANTEDNKSNNVEDKPKNRRSISDLVQRYKRILELPNNTPTYPEK